MLQEQLHSMSRSGELHPAERKPIWAGRLLTLARGLALVIVVGVCFLAYQLGLLPSVLAISLLPGSLMALVSRLWGAYRNTLEWGLVRHPLSRTVRPYALQCLNRWTCLVLITITWHIAIVPILFAPDTYRALQAVIWGGTGLWMLLALIPHKRIRLSTNFLVAAGSLFLCIELLRALQSPAPGAGVVVDAPFRGEWYVVHGGNSALINHHYPTPAQRYALDLVATHAGSYFQGDASRLESYFAFGQTLYAPADGRVAKVVDDLPDVPIGQTDAAQPAGNYISIDIGQGRFVVLAHLRQGSIRVREGSVVKRGQALAQAGNSGNTSTPHLHLQVQSHADFYHPRQQAFPFLFRQVTRVRGGHADSSMPVAVWRNDRVVSAGK